MYEAFYGLREKPFNLTPDPKYLYLSDKHKEAFAHLLFGIKNRSGFVMISGEIGTGKTTICRNLLNQLDADTQVAFVFNPSLNPIELLKKIGTEFGCPARANTVLELVDELNVYLLDAATRNKNCVLVIDEAQNLTPEVLEQIRLLSNLETETEKLLQIILIGQPELVEKLSLHELRQLNQRITARYHLKALSLKETLQYIAYRLHVAGGKRKVHFMRAAIRAVYKNSGGTPRVINAICDRALLIGYTRESVVVTKAIVKQAAKEIRGEQFMPRRRWGARLRRLLPRPAAVVAVLLIVLIIGLFAEPVRILAQQLSLFNSLLAGGGAPAAAAPAPGTTPSPVANVSPPAPLPTLQFPMAQKLIDLMKKAAPAEAAKPLDQEFVAQISGLDPAAARNAGIAELFKLWNAAPDKPIEVSDDPATVTAAAQANGFTAELLSPVIQQLEKLNLPALVKINAPGRTLWLALTRIGDDGSYNLAPDAGKTVTASREVFAAHYANEAIVFWRDPTPTAWALLTGVSGRPVLQFKETLRRLGRMNPDDSRSESYDAKTAAAVARLQAETGLTVDGIAGKQVRMVLTGWLREKGAPGLNAKAYPVLSAAVALPPETAKPKPAPNKERRAAEKPDNAAEPNEQVPNAPEPNPAKALEKTSAPAPAEPPAAGLTRAPKAPPALPPPSSAGVAPAPKAPTAPPMAPAAPSVRVQDLPKPGEEIALPPADTSARKESTPPAENALPLVPHKDGK